MNTWFCHPNIASSISFALLKLGIKAKTLLNSEWAGLLGNHIAFNDRCPTNGEMSANLLYFFGTPFIVPKSSRPLSYRTKIQGGGTKSYILWRSQRIIHLLCSTKWWDKHSKKCIKPYNIRALYTCYAQPNEEIKI